MSSTARQRLAEMKRSLSWTVIYNLTIFTATMAAADPNGIAVATRERSAAFVSFQWH